MEGSYAGGVTLLQRLRKSGGGCGGRSDEDDQLDHRQAEPSERDNTTKEAVSQHYGTTSAPALHGSNPVANAYGASQPKADGTHEPNVFDTMREWWNGTNGAQDVTSYAQSTNGDYSPVSMLKQSATTTATPPVNNTMVQPVVLQNQLPEGLIRLTISPDPTFGNMLNATVDQRITENNQRMVLAVSSGQGTGG